MKNLFLIITILTALIFSSCSTYQYQLGSMSIKDQKEKVAFLNKQEKKQLRMHNAQSRKESNDQSDLLTKADKNSLLRIKESRSNVMEDLAQSKQKKNIKVRSNDGYEAAYFYQVVNASNGTNANAEQSSQMNLLLMNKTRKRHSYMSTDPYSVDVKIYLVKPKEAKPGFLIQDAKVIRQVASTRLQAEGKKVIKLPIGFYVVDFIYNGKSAWKGRVSMLPQHKVEVSSEDLRGTNYTSQEIDNYAYVEL
ncbi:MAG TPA: hypothetical protein VJ926_01200 [Patescibacteria group bacterium]|nr:hypothetical protein [Patescibacteria group bacterium]